MMKKLFTLFIAIGLTVSVQASVNKVIKIDMKSLQTGKSVGYVTVYLSNSGLIFMPHLHYSKMPRGYHGFHLHVNPSIANAGKGAGGHWDPYKTNHHNGPGAPKLKRKVGSGHLGDLPVIYFDSNGNSTIPVLASRLHSLNMIKGHSLMIHFNGDNYSDIPKKLGGGGKRIIAGIIK